MHDCMRTKFYPRIALINGTRKDDGLTLIEVCVGMVVLSIAALGSAPKDD